MCRLKKFTIYALACLYCSAGYSQSVIPGSPSVIIGGDDVRSRDGTTCRQGTYAKPTLDFGVSVINGGANSQNGQYSLNNAANTPLAISNSNTSYGNSTYGVYARIVIPLGKDPDRVDCTQLYSLEIQRLQAELERLKITGSAAVKVE